jgi:hypothetical protein
MTTTLKAQAYGVYKGPLYPDLLAEEAELCRYSGEWVAARFLVEHMMIRPTGEGHEVDPNSVWILFHADDFDIIKGEVGPCDWCSSFDFRCTGMCKKITAGPRRESPKDGAIIQPVADPLAHLAKLLDQADPFAPYRPGPDDLRSTREGRAIVEQLEHQARTRGGAAYEYEPKVVVRLETTRYVAVIASCWLILGILIGWLGTYTWPWW